MNDILISNPFLFSASAPSPSSSSQDSDLETDTEYFTEHNISYQKSQFDQAWANSTANTEGTLAQKISKKDIFSVSSPTISSTQSLNLDELFPVMDSLGSNYGESTLNLADLNFQSVTLPFSGEQELGLNDFDQFGQEGEFDIHNFLHDDSMSMADFAPEEFEKVISYSRKEQAAIEQSTVDMNHLLNNLNSNSMTNTMPTMTMAFHENDLLGLAAPMPQQQSTEQNMQNQQNMQNTQNQQQSMPLMSMTMTRGGHKRKEVLEHRMVAQSPQQIQMAEEEIVEKKPDILALGINNGQQRAGTKRRNSANSNSGSPSSSNSRNNANNSKKPRKYELDVEDDPSVKNAKAAKMNRDRKKKERMEMANKISDLESRVQSLEVDLERTTEEKERYKSLLLAEKAKNAMSDGVGRNMTNMKKIFEAIIAPLNQTFENPFTVEFPDQFSQIPALVDGERIRTFVGDNLTLDPQRFGNNANNSPGSASTFTTFHISPQERTIRLDYDPNLQ